MDKSKNPRIKVSQACSRVDRIAKAEIPVNNKQAPTHLAHHLIFALIGECPTKRVRTTLMAQLNVEPLPPFH
jgi:hypothetical protein